MRPVIGSSLTDFREPGVIPAEARKDAGGREKAAQMFGMLQDATKRLRDSSRELAGLLTLLRGETDAWSRKVIMTEAAIKLSELERELEEFVSSGGGLHE